MSKLLLVDGHNVIHKAWNGIPEKLLPDGRPVHGVIGFVSIVTKLIKITEPTHVLVVFDPEEKPSRAAFYPEYKQGSLDHYEGKPLRENLFSQLAGIIIALDSLLIKYVIQPGYEADDMIA